MPLAGTGLILGAALAVAGLITDPTGLADAGGLGEALADWIVSHGTVNNPPLAPLGTLLAGGSAVTGAGRIIFTGSGDDLGLAMAASIPVTDTKGLVLWKKLGNAIHDHVEKYGRANPTAFVAVPTGGAVSGTGTLSFASTVFDTPLATVLGLTDTTNQALWLAIGAALLAHLSANALVNGTGFTSPSGGGPLVGVSTVA